MQYVNYEEVSLYKDGRLIKWPRVVGVAWEKAQKVADLWGYSTLAPSHLEGFVSFSKVQRRGDVDVGLADQDAPLAVNAVKAVQEAMSKSGFNCVGPSDRVVKSTRGWCVYNQDGDLLRHDLVHEHKTPGSGLWSTEVRCVNVRCLAGLEAARKRCRKEVLAFWELMQEAGADPRWSGRILVLVWLKDDRKTFEVRGDIFTPARGWSGLFGWRGGASVVASMTPRTDQQAARQPEVQAARQPAGGQPRRRAARHGRKPPWSEVEPSLFPSHNHKLYGLRPRTKVARVLQVFAKAKRENKHCKEKLQGWFGDGSLGFREGRDYGKGSSTESGGPETWVATLPACKKIYELS